MVTALAITAAMPNTQFVIVSVCSEALGSGEEVGTEDGSVTLVVWGGNAVAIIAEDTLKMVEFPMIVAEGSGVIMIPIRERVEERKHRKARITQSL